MAMLAMLILPLSILGFTALAAVLPAGPRRAWPTPGPHGFSEILYAYTSAHREQRLGLRRPHRQHALLQHHPRPRHAASAASLMIVPMLAIAGSLAAKKIVPRLGRHLPDRTAPLFVGLLIGVILIVGGLHVLPGPRARPDRRALRDARRHTCSDRGAS